MRTIVAIDTETDPIGPGNVVPNLICASFATRHPTGDLTSFLFAHCEEEELEEVLEGLLTNPDVLLVFLNAGFDLAVIARWCPRLVPLIWSKLATCEQVTDVAVREKLMNLGTTGMLMQRERPDGTFAHVEYSLAALAELHLGEDLSESKGDEEDIWRTSYHGLRGKRAEDYPDEARDYAIGDATRTLRIYETQEAIKAQRYGSPVKGQGSTWGEHYKTSLQFALRLISARGMMVDPVERDRLIEWVEGELDDSNHPLLIATGILRPAKGGRPAANQTKRLAAFFECSIEEAKKIITERPWTEDELAAARAGGIKITASKKSSIDKGRLAEHIVEVSKKNDIAVRNTEPSPSHPEGQVSTDERVIKALAGVDDVMAEYQHRQSLGQIATKELPAMAARVVHFNLNEMVESLRTSSHGAGKKKLYPATNGQNINPEVRRAYVARPGMVLCSIDFDRLELCTLAQTCFTLFGKSVMRDKINAGVDLHSYLGARIACALDPDFGLATQSFAADADKLYAAFMVMKTAGDGVLRAKYEKFRKLAKPTGLGYPGGLGAKTFVRYAGGKKYDVVVDEGTAQVLRDVWFDTYPEMRLYFDHISQQCEDTANSGRVDEDTGRPIRRYAYSSPLGMYRAGCAFTEAANGFGMQTHAADGFGIGIFNVVRACCDPDVGSPLYGAHVLDVIHDEQILEFEWSGCEDLGRERAMEAALIMLKSMEQVVPDVMLGAKPALMLRWDKRAEPVFDAEGKLQVWMPPAETVA